LFQGVNQLPGTPLAIQPGHLLNGITFASDCTARNSALNFDKVVAAQEDRRPAKSFLQAFGRSGAYQWNNIVSPVTIAYSI